MLIWTPFSGGEEKTNHINFNCAKTLCIHFFLKHLKIEPNLIFNSVLIVSVDSLGALGERRSTLL